MRMDAAAHHIDRELIRLIDKVRAKIALELMWADQDREMQR